MTELEQTLAAARERHAMASKALRGTLLGGELECVAESFTVEHHACSMPKLLELACRRLV